MDPRKHQVGGDHYKKLPIQPIEYTVSNGLGFVEGNVVKYVTRWKDKGGIDDLRKARHYLDMYIAHLVQEPSDAPETTDDEADEESYYNTLQYWADLAHRPDVVYFPKWAFAGGDVYDNVYNDYYNTGE